MLKKNQNLNKNEILEELSANLNAGKLYKSYIFPINKINSKALIKRAKEKKNKFLYWRKPSEDFAFLAVNSIKELTAKTGELLIEEVNHIKNNLESNISDYGDKRFPLIVGGVKFNEITKSEIWGDFKYHDWFLPRATFILINGDYFLTINLLPREKFDEIKNEIGEILDAAFSLPKDEKTEKGQTPKIKKNGNHDRVVWEKRITEALRLILNGDLDKIVISRFVNHTLDIAPDYHGILTELSSSFPFCTIFGFNSGESFFFGATPETLFTVHNSELETDALAGSIERGKNIYEDDVLANELLSSDKNLREHKKVVDFLISRLEKHSVTIIYKDTPKIRKLRNIQHLWTPINAKLKKNVNLLSILYDIHPTPAVCGSPQKIAYDKIPDIENFERGLFTGVIGWFNFSDVGDFSVAIRSGLIKGKELNAYAGCGIVNGSDADEEFLETKLKLQPVLSLFEENEY
jgi:menaquinone-specific isochorismate synthase